MGRKSFLLALDGSQEAMFAAEAAWRLAEINNAKVVAQTVVDSQAIWQFVGNDLPGIIGNSPYLAAHEVIRTALKSISETLLLAYESKAKGHNIESETVLDEGNTVSEIVKRAAQHDLVIIGHRYRGKIERDSHNQWYSRYSLAGDLAYYCPKPLLIVANKPEQWKAIRLVVSEETFDSQCLNVFLELAKPLKVSQEIFCIGEDDYLDRFIDKVRKTVPDSENIHLLSQPVGEGEPAWECAIDVPTSTLLMITTKVTEKEDKLVAGQIFHTL